MNQGDLLSKKIVQTAYCRSLEIVNGPTGDTGPSGTHGSLGPEGATGATGPIGQTGYTGSVGYTGSIGAQGSQGLAGSATATGSTGTRGDIGYTGPQGLSGSATATGATGSQGPAGQNGGASIGVIKVPAGITNFNFGAAVSTLPETFATFIPGNSDASSFNLALNSKYTTENLPFYIVSAYVYSSTAGFINCQRQLGTHAGVAAAFIKMDIGNLVINFNYMNKTNFPYTSNDSQGYALYIFFNILN